MYGREEARLVCFVYFFFSGCREITVVVGITNRRRRDCIARLGATPAVLVFRSSDTNYWRSASRPALAAAL